MEKQKRALCVVLFLFLFCLSQAFSASCGDVNANGVIDIVDALLVAQSYVGLNPSNFDVALADVNADSVVDIVDALRIAQFYVGLVSELSCSAGVTPAPSGSVSIACGSTAAVGSFQADQYYSGGSTYNNTNTVDVSVIGSNPPPAALFNNERYGAMSYTIPGFTAGGTYAVTLYFAETLLASSGSRLFNVFINGSAVLTNFDILSNAGGQNKAVAMAFTTAADGNGQVIIQFSAVTENPKINGIDIRPGTAPTPGPTAVPTATPATNSSAGCGKVPVFTSGSRTIVSSGSSREYTIDIPSGYNPNNPYRLIFCFHWIGATDASVVNGQVTNGGAVWAYYGLKNQANLAGQPAIFIAPTGLNGSWGQVDHQLFDDLLSFAEEQLCIDKSRVFATGFSFGAMMTYSLSLNHQSQLRAVTCLAPANYNIYLPTNLHLPIAYMSTTGMSDGTCPWDSGGRGGKYCAIGHAQDNGCVIPASIPTNTTAKSHLCYDFTGCQTGYPVKVCTFDGGHIAAHADGTTSDNGATTWMPVVTWQFFSQF
jgi:poly(3-hydroxybutyrate) depolymerase